MIPDLLPAAGPDLDRMVAQHVSELTGAPVEAAPYSRNISLAWSLVHWLMGKPERIASAHLLDLSEAHAAVHAMDGSTPDRYDMLIHRAHLDPVSATGATQAEAVCRVLLLL